MKIFGQKIKLSASAILIIILCWTCALSSVLANYMVADSADAYARIAVFEMVSQKTSGDAYMELTLNSKTSASKSQVYVVQNYNGTQTSEVAMNYKVIVQVGSQLPRGATLTLNDENQTINFADRTPSVSNGIYTYTFEGYSFEANKQTARKFTLTLTVNNNDGTAVSTYKDPVNITVHVIANQR